MLPSPSEAEDEASTPPAALVHTLQCTLPQRRYLATTFAPTLNGRILRTLQRCEAGIRAFLAYADDSIGFHGYGYQIQELHGLLRGLAMLTSAAIMRCHPETVVADPTPGPSPSHSSSHQSSMSTSSSTDSTGSFVAVATIGPLPPMTISGYC